MTKNIRQFLLDRGYSLEAVNRFSIAEVRDIIDRILRRRANDKKRRQAKTKRRSKEECRGFDGVTGWRDEG